jgi:hypothetical protein
LWQAFSTSYCKLTILRALIGIANHSPASRNKALAFIEKVITSADDKHASDIQKMSKKALGMMYLAINTHSHGCDALCRGWVEEYKDIKIENAEPNCIFLG